MSGAGSAWYNSGDLYIGRTGSGRLTVADGGVVTVTKALYASPGDLYGDGLITANGAVLDADLVFDTADALIQTLSFGTSGTLRLNIDGTAALGAGHRGNASLLISGGTLVTSAGGCLGFSSNSVGLARVSGTGTKWTTSGDLYVGKSGNGTLLVDAGGLVVSSSAQIGYAAGSIGSASVSGEGSKWNSTTLIVGESGSGNLGITSGARASGGNSKVGNSAGSTGIVTVSGTGSRWAPGLLYVGASGNGSLIVDDSGQVSSSSSYLGYNAGSAGTVSITGMQSTWTTNGGSLYVGHNGSGSLMISAGAQVNNGDGHLARNAGSTGVAVVRGAGSKWTNSGRLYAGHSGNGMLRIEAGGEVVSTGGDLGREAGSTGTATVSGVGSKWTNSAALSIGSAGTGSLTVADDGTVTAKALIMNTSQSAVRLHVSGDNMLVLGDASTTGSLTNLGVISFYADASLPAGTYRPISEYAGRTMAWSGTGTYKPFGGTWNNTAKTFTVAEPTALSAGDTDALIHGERILFTDTTGQKAGASFGFVPANTTFSAAPMTPANLASLANMLNENEDILSAWTFTTNFTGTEAMLSFDIGPGAEDLAVWHYSNGVWSSFTPTLFTHDANGLASFTVSSFSGYAISAAVPEPASLGLLAFAGSILLARRRK